ncbi:MAG: topoisomerase IV [Patescibacteria group bacterium]|nr:topoisomerase IV [Patescibacteria group bacterium]
MDFYDGLLSTVGWKKIESNALSNGETKIYFVEQNVKLGRNIGPRHICFLADSRAAVDRAGNFLTKLDADIIRGPLESKYKDRTSYTVDFRDPDGYVIEVATASES